MKKEERFRLMLDREKSRHRLFREEFWSVTNTYVTLSIAVIAAYIGLLQLSPEGADKLTYKLITSVVILIFILILYSSYLNRMKHLNKKSVDAAKTTKELYDTLLK